MPQTTTNALKARAFLRKYYPQLGNRTGASALWTCLRSAPTLIVLVFRGVLNATRRKKLGTNVRACNAVSRFHRPGIPSTRRRLRCRYQDTRVSRVSV
jgi:hypothetical protein